MLDKKFVNKFPAVRLIHRHIPNACDEQTQNRSPNQTNQKSFRRKSPLQKIIKRDNRKRENDPDQTFGDQRNADEKVKQSERRWLKLRHCVNDVFVD